MRLEPGAAAGADAIRELPMADTALFLLRHAHAGDRDQWSGSDDERPLSSKGREQAARMADYVSALPSRPDAVISSPKVRAFDTAVPVAERLGVPVRVDERLGSFLSPTVVDAILADAGDPRRPVLVGHDPDFSELLGELTGLAAPGMRKGALAEIAIGRPVGAGTGRLRLLLAPDAIPG
jgi:phosphohistidine phosphatase SixA